MAGDLRVESMDEPATERVIVEEDKCTWDDTARVVLGPEIGPNLVSIKCPECHRQMGVFVDQPYRHICGALLMAKKEG